MKKCITILLLVLMHGNILECSKGPVKTAKPVKFTNLTQTQLTSGTALQNRQAAIAKFDAAQQTKQSQQIKTEYLQAKSLNTPPPIASVSPQLALHLTPPTGASKPAATISITNSTGSLNLGTTGSIGTPTPQTGPSIFQKLAKAMEQRRIMETVTIPQNQAASKIQTRWNKYQQQKLQNSSSSSITTNSASITNTTPPAKQQMSLDRSGFEPTSTPSQGFSLRPTTTNRSYTQAAKDMARNVFSKNNTYTTTQADGTIRVETRAKTGLFSKNTGEVLSAKTKFADGSSKTQGKDGLIIKEKLQDGTRHDNMKYDNGRLSSYEISLKSGKKGQRVYEGDGIFTETINSKNNKTSTTTRGNENTGMQSQTSSTNTNVINTNTSGAKAAFQGENFIVQGANGKVQLAINPLTGKISQPKMWNTKLSLKTQGQQGQTSTGPNGETITVFSKNGKPTSQVVRAIDGSVKVYEMGKNGQWNIEPTSQMTPQADGSIAVTTNTPQKGKFWGTTGNTVTKTVTVSATGEIASQSTVTNTQGTSTTGKTKIYDAGTKKPTVTTTTPTGPEWLQEATVKTRTNTQNWQESLTSSVKNGTGTPSWAESITPQTGIKTGSNNPNLIQNQPTTSRTYMPSSTSLNPGLSTPAWNTITY